MRPALLLIVLAAPLPSRAADEAPRQRILLVLIDALRADHVGAYGYPRPTTPRIDALAAAGTRYERAYVNAPWTRASTGCFLTGVNASRHRAETAQSKLPAEVVTIAQRLRKAGWATAGFTANGNGGSLAGFERGFDLFEDPTRTYSRKGRKARCSKRFADPIPPDQRQAAIAKDCIRYNRLPTGEFLVGRVLDHLARSEAEREFVFVFLVDPHDPYGAPPAWERLFLGDFQGKPKRRARWEHDNDYSQAERFSLMALYDAGIRYADLAVGQLIDGLRASDSWDGTTLFITADHGEGMGEHGFYLHAHHFWEEVIHVPLVAVGPRFQPAVDGRLTQSLDVASTILELAGVVAGDLPGRSLLAAADPDATVISEYNEFGIHRQAILSNRYKLIWQRPADEAWYLRTARKKEFFPSVRFDREVVRVFDRQADPGERHDLAGSMPAAAKALLEQLRAFVAGAPGS
jgi:arylsulfatase A-like enzyme